MRTIRLRRLLYQLHLWSGVSLGLYIFFISITGSVLVYRNELYVAVTPEPIISESSESSVQSSERMTGVWLVSKLIELHADLLAGPNGRKVNGIGALAVLLSVTTGLLIWWPGTKNWRRAVTVRREGGWRSINWDLHGVIGFWGFGFAIVFSVSGLYLCFPEVFHGLADKLDPRVDGVPGVRFVDSVLSWLAYSHFGRINGIGLPCSGPGLCDQATKAIWAVFGLAPAGMFVTGAIMWWDRVLRPWWRGTL